MIVYVVYVGMEATTTKYLVQESFEGRIVWRMGRWEDLKKEFEILPQSGLVHISDVLASDFSSGQVGPTRSGGPFPARLRFIYFKGPTAKDFVSFHLSS